MPVLPRRHRTAEMQEGVLRAGEVQARARGGDRPKTPLPWRIVAVVLPLGLALGLAARDRTRTLSPSWAVPFDRDRLVSADLAGLQVSTEQLVTEAPALRDPSPSSPSSPPPSARARERRGAAPSAGRPEPSPAPTTCEACRKAGIEEATETLFEAPEELPASHEAVRIALGTRIPAILQDPITTSPEGAPVTASVLNDVLSRGRLAIPSGSRLEGLAFGTDSDDRARILMTAVVISDRTSPLPSVVLDSDGMLGLPGKVISRGSKSRQGGGLLLRALGGAAGYGLGGSAGLAGAALSELGSDVSQSISSITRDWRVSGKAIRVPSGTRIVCYVRAEAEIP